MTDIHREGMFPVEEAPCAAEGLRGSLMEFTGIADAELTTLGWERRFTAESTRLSEYVELYAALGFEVCTRPVMPDELGSLCAACRLVLCRQFATIYTRQSARHSSLPGESSP